MRLVIADDNYLVRESLRDMFDTEPDIEVVGEAADGQEAVALCNRLRPDLVLMDVQMPRMDGLSATRQIKNEFPKIGVLVLTMYENPDYLLEALRAGCAGYILKDASQQEVLTAVRQVLGGESSLNPELAARLLRQLALQGHKQHTRVREPQRPGEVMVEPLTPRELEVLRFMKGGLTNRQIAQELSISPPTVKRHVEHITAKLGVSDRTQAVVRSLELGLLGLIE